MSRRNWFAAVALGLGAWLPGLSAQDTNWRPTAKPAPPTPIATSSVTMERPVPISRGSSAGLERSPRPFPSAYRTGAPLPLNRPLDRDPIGGVQPIATVSPPGNVIAVSGQTLPSQLILERRPQPLPMPAPQAQEVEDDGLPSELFAMDQRAQRRPVEQMETIRRTNNWTPPPPQQPLPPLNNERVHHQPLPVVPEAHHAAAPADWWPKQQTAEEAGFAPRFYVRAEYLLWMIKEDHAPPLVTTGDFNVVSTTPGMVSIPGALNRGDTVVLNDGDVTKNPFSGARFTAGLVIDDCGDKAIEVGGFFLGQRSNEAFLSSAQVPFLARPFFAANPGPSPNLPREFIEIVSLPGVQAGSVRISSPTQFGGLNANLTCKLCCDCDYRVNALIGGRYLSLRERLTITEDNQISPNVVLPEDSGFRPGDRVVTSDSFATRNTFYGLDMGLSGRWYHGKFDVDGFAKLAVGTTRQTVEINGSQTIFRNGQTLRFDGGLLALPSNIGRESRDRFSVVPETGVSLGYNFSDRLRVSVGYNFLYWSSVVRPSDQIDRNLDVRQIPNFVRPTDPLLGGALPTNPTAPQRLFRDNDFWAHGLTVGVEVKF